MDLAFRFDDHLQLVATIVLVLWLVLETLLHVLGLRQRSARDRESLSLHLLKLSFNGAIIYSMLDAAALRWTTIGPRFTILRWAVLPLVLAGVAVRITARASLGRHFSPYVQTTEGHRLMTTGIYRRVRHPAYLGWLLLMFAFPVCFGSAGGLVCAALLGVPALLYRIRVEEASLEKWFPEEYSHYRANTYKLIPGVW